jgi:hypothetical protein
VAVGLAGNFWPTAAFLKKTITKAANNEKTSLIWLFIGPPSYICQDDDPPMVFEPNFGQFEKKVDHPCST